MKKALHILTLILSALLSTGNIIAQNTTVNDSLIFYSDGGFSGNFVSIVSKDDYIKYFTKITGVKRVDDRTILLKPQGYLKSLVRIEVDKGQISCMGRQRDFYSMHRGREVLEEGKTFAPTDVIKWKVKFFSEEEKDITINIYNNITNELIAQKSFNLTSGFKYSYLAELQYTDTNGNIQTTSGDVCLYSLPIDYNKTMRVIAYDGFGKKYPVISFIIKPFDYMGGTLFENSNCDTLTIKQKNQLRRASTNNTCNYFICDICCIGRDGKKSEAEAIYFRKK